MVTTSSVHGYAMLYIPVWGGGGWWQNSCTRPPTRKGSACSMTSCAWLGVRVCHYPYNGS